MVYHNAQGIITSTIFLNHPEVWVFDEYSTYAGQKTLTEPFIENFEKFNSNSGVVFSADGTNWSSLMQALSHFSYHMTGGHYVLCDLQGGIITKGKGISHSHRPRHPFAEPGLWCDRPGE
jgi:hypothetical protein